MLLLHATNRSLTPYPQPYPQAAGFSQGIAVEGAAEFGGVVAEAVVVEAGFGIEIFCREPEGILVGVGTSSAKRFAVGAVFVLGRDRSVRGVDEGDDISVAVVGP